MDPEEIAVTLSEQPESTMVETPSELTPETPAVVETAQPAESEVKLFDLPDGRKVDAETLQKEWKENFLPDYTRKSQTLAEIEKSKINQTSTKPYDDPNWQPPTWKDAIQLAKQEALDELSAKEQAQVEQQKAIESEVVNQLTELKTLDPKLNENTLFLHANKYGFTDLKTAYHNMKDMSDMAKKVQTTTAANIAKRNDPVSTGQGAATGAKSNPTQFGNALEYFRSLNK